MRVRCLSTAFVIGVLLATAAWAGTTGSISGYVFDEQGQGKPGVVVKVSGDLLPAGRTVTTAEDGSFRFPLLAPGTYTVEVVSDAARSAKRAVRVEVDKDSQADLTLGVEVREEVTVTATSAVVDVKSTEVSRTFSLETIKDLPVVRTYTGLFQLVPGVADNRSFGPSAGGSRQDNVYLIDGVNITNPGYGYLESEVNELDIQEFNVKRGAITAEFGRAAGIVANAVSRSGTNQISGSVRLLWQPLSFMAKPDDPAFGVSRRDDVNPAGAIGGPILRDKIFFYGSAQYFSTTIPDRENKFGTALPDAETKGSEYFGKISSTITAKHLVDVNYRYRKSDSEGQGVGASSSPTVATTDESRAQIAMASWSWFIRNSTILETKYLYMQNKTTSVPVTDLGYLPQPFDINNLPAMGMYTDVNQANLVVGGYEYTGYANYKRQQVKVNVTQFLDIGKTTHEIKGGFAYTLGQEDFNRLSNGWGQISRITAATPYYRARYYFEQPPQVGEGRTWSIFAQDAITIAGRLTINLGVLLNSDAYSQTVAGSGGCPTPFNTPTGQASGVAVFESDGDRCTFVKFGMGSEIQPRLGVSYALREGAGDKAYVNWGRYYNMDQMSSSRSLAPRRIYQREARYNAITGALISDLPRASTTGKLIDPDLEPTYNDEWVAGYATPFAQHWNADVFYIYRSTTQFIEDVPSVYPSGGPYAAGNLPCGLWLSCQNADAERKYKAFTAEVSRRLANRWSTSISYTWSRFEGNFDLDYSGTAVFNTSSFIQDGPGTFVEDQYRYGPLRQDRPHVFKAFGNYAIVEPFTVGGYLRVQSGTPWNARGQDSQGTAALYYLEPAGSHRNPTWTNFDLLASYRLNFAERVRLVFEGRVFNLFDNQEQTSTDSVKYTDYVGLSAPPYIAPGTLLNSFYGTGNSYAAGRRFVLTARLDF